MASKKKLVAETGAGQHGVASATVAALFDMELVVFMGSEDIKDNNLMYLEWNYLVQRLWQLKMVKDFIGCS